MSTRPNFLTPVSTIASQLVSEFGRFATASTFPPSFVHSPAIFLSSSALPPQITTLAPAPASTFAASAPKAPVAPVTIAVLPRISNSESGFLRKSSDMTDALSLRRHPSRRAQERAHLRMTDHLSFLRRRHRDQHGDDIVATVDDLPGFVRTDEAGIVRLEDGFLAARDQRELAREHVVDLFRRRGVRPGAAARQKMRQPDRELFGSAGIEPEQA